MYTEKLKTVDLTDGGGQRLGGLETGWLPGDRIQLDRRVGVQYSTVPQGNHGGWQYALKKLQEMIWDIPTQQ